MLKLKCSFCHKPLQSIDFYLDTPKGIICSRCIVKHKIPVLSSSLMVGSYTEPPKPSSKNETHTGQPLSHPSMKQVLVHELELLLNNTEIT